jgi:TrmH family RNA methyltransferase
LITVVLDEPQELVNIAHVVRAMKNFGVRDLRLVAPAEYDAWRIGGIAHRTSDVLKRVRQFATLSDALADCVHVAGFTARGRTAKRNAQRPREAAAEITALGETGTVALLFGREDRGLSNEALDLCHRLVTIPSEAGYPSLNLAHAVTIALYELALAGGAEAQPLKPPRRRAGPATVRQLEQLFADAEQTLAAARFFKSHQRAGILRTLREIVHRVPLDEREAKLLRAMAREIQKKLP